MGKDLRPLGPDVLGQAPWGTHLCLFYESAEDLTEVLVPYFQAGLENHEFCMWVTSEPLGEQAAKEAMRRSVVDFDEYLRRGQIEIVAHADWYLRDGVFDTQTVLAAWIGKLNEALVRGYDGMRLSGNTAWLEREDWRAFTEYEEAVDKAIGKHRMIAICTYLLERCGASEVMDVVSNHEFALVRRERRWERIESSGRQRAERETQGLSEQIDFILGATKTGLDIIDADFNIRFIDSEWQRVYGDPKGKKCYEYFMGRSEPCPDCSVALTLRTKQPVVTEEILVKEGNRPVQVTTIPFQNERGEWMVAEVNADISERKRAEEALRQRTHDLGERVKELSCLYGASALMVGQGGSLDEVLQGVVALIPPAWQYADITCARIIFQGQEFKTDDFAETEWKQSSDIAASGETVGSVEVCYLQEKPPAVEGPFSPEERKLIDGLARATGAFVERKRAEEESHRYQRQLGLLASRLALSGERERRRIAAYLHDRVGQSLAVARIKLGALWSSPLASGLDEALHDVAELIDEAIEDTHSVTFDLSSPVLYELGFEAAVKWLAEETQERHGIATEFETDGQPKPMGEDVRVVLYQAVKELLVNVVKHAQAGKAKVSVERDGGDVRVTVADDGVGFNVSEARPGRSGSGGFGLFNIRERLAQLGGHFGIQSEPGRGTRVILVAPLERDDRNTQEQ